MLVNFQVQLIPSLYKNNQAESFFRSIV
jgi:hypothetical protein